jgi:hypothetical protein
MKTSGVASEARGITINSPRLQFLAKFYGRAEPILLAHGFSKELLAGLLVMASRP